MSDEGFIMLSRGVFDHWLWSEPREKTRWEAWIDLVATASWRENKLLVKTAIVKVPRGGIVASERFLSDRWMWSRTKVRAFLDLLEADKMIRREKDRENTVILLCNFEMYNAVKEPRKDHGKTTGEPRKDQTKEGEEGKEDVPPNARGCPKTAGDVKAYAATLPLSPTLPIKADDGFCEWWFDEQERKNWCDAGIPIHNWQAGFRSAWRARVHREQERQVMRGGRVAPKLPAKEDKW